MTPRRAVKCAGTRVPAHTAELNDHSRAMAGWPSALADQAVGYATWPRRRNRPTITSTGMLTRTAQALQGLQAASRTSPSANQTVTRKQVRHPGVVTSPGDDRCEVGTRVVKVRSRTGVHVARPGEARHGEARSPVCVSRTSAGGRALQSPGEGGNCARSNRGPWCEVRGHPMQRSGVAGRCLTKPGGWPRPAKPDQG